MSNLLLNSRLDPDLDDALGRPAFWGHDAAYTDQAGAGICDTAVITGPFGDPVRALRVARDNPAPGSGGGPMWLQTVFLTAAPANVVYTRQRPIPTVGAQFPPTLDYAVYVKANNVSHDAFLALAIVDYTPDETGAGTNVTSGAHYFDPLGPNDGSGTFDWTVASGSLEEFANTTVVANNISIGLHGELVTGEAYIWWPRLTVPA
jgi:hypothetical protein